MRIRKQKVLRVCSAILILILGTSEVLYAQETGIAREGPFTYLFDTGASSSAPRSGESLSKRARWTKLAEDKVTHKFEGDVVFLNDKLIVVLRRGTCGAEIYSRSDGNLKMQALLTPAPASSDASRGGGPVGEDQAIRLSSVKIVRNNPTGVAVDAGFKAAGGQTLILRYELQMGRTFIKTESRRGTARLRVEAPCRFAVLPDFFADDIVVDAEHIPISKAELPSENFIMHMLGNGQAILMCVWDKRGEDVRIRLSGRGGNRAITSSEIHYGNQGKVWIAVLEDEGIWHTHEVAGNDADKIIRLKWERPYPAQWRVDWRLDNNLTDSWEMISQKPGGGYVKHGWFGQPESLGTPDWMKPDRQRWTTVLGRFQYPCWVDTSGQGFLQPLKKKLRFQGPAIIYPINRLKETPIDKFMVVDIVRQTLGVGPCEYILDVEGQQKESAGIATCAARDKLNAIYGKKLQKNKRAEVEKALVDVLAFVQHIRVRIDDYVAFGRQIQKYLAEQKKAHRELAEPLAEMETITRRIDEYLAQRAAAIKTPEYAVGLVEGFRTRLIDYEGDDALEKCKKTTAALVKIGGNQDELVGECRMAVKILRQRAGLIMATEPRMANIAREIRRRTRQMLRNPVSYEAPRH
ncbi:MAG: hypothetical protein KAY65_08975 [Planctomycetes bacterium]|nr:hypothetical protein [Planctomycetota bacterium]